jgi:hypothetical protein
LKTEQRKAKSECGRSSIDSSDRAGRERYLSQASKTDNVRHDVSWFEEVRTSDTDSLRSLLPNAFGLKEGMISMESLILAQDERWRRA